MGEVKNVLDEITATREEVDGTGGRRIRHQLIITIDSTHADSISDSRRERIARAEIAHTIFRDIEYKLMSVASRVKRAGLKQEALEIYEIINNQMR